MEQALTVYKASAGSGKTFTLASEYITLVVKNPQDYRSILAVTFTNKATQEMKTRILSQLYGIAHSLPDSEAYYEQVRMKTGFSEQTIRENAAKALSLLTHHYNDFRVQTIDAFFQSVLRNLARELNLTANLRVDLNDEQVEAQAVDELINSLEEGEEVLNWIRDYIDKNIEDDKGWNVISQIKDFGKNIFKDFYKDHKTELDNRFSNKSFFNGFITDLRKRRTRILNRLNEHAKQMYQKIRDANLDNPNLFNGKTKGLLPHIIKLTKGTPSNDATPQYVQSCIDSAEKWPASKCPAEEKAAIIELASASLCSDLKILNEYRINDWREYQSCNLTLKHLSQLRLLHAISEAVDEINKDTNRFMLSNTQSLLCTLMKDSDTPFVFEKMGAYLKHIMIDEFQDTSTIQWNNFRKLLDNCMAQVDSHNLIVGDVKQSIYRWRQGDWKLLNNIEHEFTKEQIKIEPLDTNYRSEENIIRFNNTFFKQAVLQTVNELESEEIQGATELVEAYKEIEQKPRKDNGKGCVRIKLFRYDSKNASDYKQKILNELIENIRQLLDQGYKQKDIAILARSKTVIPDIVDSFQNIDKDVSLVSDEAFRLDASLAVNVIIEALRLLTHPHDKLTESKLVKLYQQQVIKTGKDINDLFVGENSTELKSFLPSGYIDKFESLSRLSLIDLVDEIYSLFSLDSLEGQSAYVCTFYDTLNEYLRDHPADIDDFIEEWEDTLSSNTIQSDEVDGIRLITIHKSKGLEYDNVLIPFCDWELEKTNGITIWCSGDDKEKPYGELPLIPVDYSSKMLGTVFEDDYKEEHLQNTVDNMNLLYVAFTRAGKNLFITGKKYKERTSGKSERSHIIQYIIEELAKELPGAIIDDAGDNGPISFELGTLSTCEERVEKGKATENPFELSPKTHKLKIETFPHPVSFRQSNKSHDFIKGEDIDPSDARRYIKVGNVLHQLFSTILTEADIEPRLKELEQAGIIYNDDITSRELQNKISCALSDEKVKNWFSPRWKLFNECTILDYDKETGDVYEHRPDRVMTDGKEMIVVDFKFGKPRDEYHEQVQRYMRLLMRMGYKQVSGYIWYVLRNEIVPTSLPS
ncbi:DNA helicase UvrD [Prevotella jejuni]|uniref:DNA 3'-5' helicase n=1 Tax=Prevotella jejuni TaxID=1177574 RepID=A0A2K9HB36_9BACT|nr:UvrD-helicase domain-containing protein [Prevotella jejuni]AUI55831.1 DNA helicase UvrD [Prevotella jejuni]SNR61275.1 ATP-dependent exoDNAse (exonuclease V) beta subunit (contains helicase and exonuclease domains) [Prevotella jejuni]